MSMSTSLPASRTRVRDVLDDVLSGLETVRLADRTGASDQDRLSWVEKLMEAERRVGALKTVMIGEADEAGSAMRAAHTTLPDWLARSGQDSPRRAIGAVWKARELERRPRVRDAAASGQISLIQASAINHALDALPTRLDAGQRRHAEDLILAAADHLPPEKLRALSDRLVDQVAPQLADTPEQRAERLEARDSRARARRCLRFGPETDGSIDLSGSLPVVDGRQLQQLLQAIADRGYRAAKDTRNRAALAQTPQQRLADALVTLSTTAEATERGGRTRREGGSARVAGPRERVADRGTETVAAGVEGAQTVPSDAAKLVVVVPYDQLLDRAIGHGLLMEGTSVSPSELRRLACSADIIPVVLDGASKIIDVGRTHRLAPPPLRLAVGLRDGGCAFPGCSVPIWHCDVHHIVPWQEGGPTDLANVVALCRTHHGLIEPAPPQRLPDGSAEHVDQWQVRITGRGLPQFIPPAAADPIRKPISHVQELLDTG
jgi:hypothetical protein